MTTVQSNYSPNVDIVTAGVHMGIENVKAVIMKNGKILGRGKTLSGGAKRSSAAEAALGDALKEARLAKSDIGKTVATGKGKFDLPFADDTVTEAITAAKAAEFLCPGATTAIDAGADETLVVTLGKDRPVLEMALNEKCAAGVGLLLKNIARRLDMTLEDMSAVPPKAPGGPSVNDGCAVFAELDALSLLNHGASATEVASAVTDAAAIRICMTYNDITIPATEKVALFGGLTKNAALVNALKLYAKTDLVIPDEAEYAGALGAALIGAGWGLDPFPSRS
jgi:predicted CoA-substrate-specific enzyme activase